MPEPALYQRCMLAGQKTMGVVLDPLYLYLSFGIVILTLLVIILRLWSRLGREREAHLETLQKTALFQFQAQEASRLRELYQSLMIERQSLEIRIAELQKEQTLEKQAFAEKLELMEETRTRFSQVFESLSTQALEKSTRSFLSLANETLGRFQEEARGDLKLRQQAVGELVKPLKEALGAVDSKLQNMEKERVGAYEGLKAQVMELAGTQKELRKETANLVKALRAPHIRGRWGEMQLRRVVELSGMSPHCDFVEQPTLEGDQTRLRPDMIVHLPMGKRLLIDAKAPLSAYLEALEATDDRIRTECLREHARQVKNHIIALSGRSYWQYDSSTGNNGESPEFVILFLPGDTFFSAALEHDPSLIELGVEKKVILTTPTTLIALLHAIAYGWRQERLAENAREISSLGKELYKRLSDMGSHMDKLGSDLTSAVKSYNRAVGTIESRVLPSARRFRDLQATGANTEIQPLEYIDEITRSIQAPELILSGNNNKTDMEDEAKKWLEPADQNTLQEQGMPQTG